jgi:hypothetical protein
LQFGDDVCTEAEIVCVHETGKTRRQRFCGEPEKLLNSLKKATMKKVTLSAKILAAATLGFGIFTLAPAANATSLVPTTEGEIALKNNGNICLSDATNCIKTAPLGYTVESFSYDPNYKASLLFVDNSATQNSYSKGTFGITFLKTDEGTTSEAGQNWFRGVALDKKGNPVENGRLEVGVFEFVFNNVVNGLKLNFFDVEDGGFSGLLQVNGKEFKTLLPGGPDKNIQTLPILNNVTSFRVKLGEPKTETFRNTGDGVLLQASVPEPGNVVSLGVLAVAGMFGVRKGKKASQVN